MKELKKIMTDLAAGRITKEEADILEESLKTHQDKPVKKFKGNTHKRKKLIKSREEK